MTWTTVGEDHTGRDTARCDLCLYGAAGWG